ncbi:MAG: hypothetical protein HC898_01085 [Phycisphaerales bacterium]|nr:hypothetical protein [Phycisphaerales bacterium]
MDSLWVIALGSTGLVGLAGLFASLLLAPVTLLAKRGFPGPWLGGGSLFACLLLSVYATDCLFNGMVNPVYVLFAGGLSGMLALPQVTQSQLARGPGRPVTQRIVPSLHGAASSISTMKGLP